MASSMLITFHSLSASLLFCRSSCFYELSSVSFEPLLAGYTAKIICLATVSDLELGLLFVQNSAANRISMHYVNLMEKCAF